MRYDPEIEYLRFSARSLQEARRKTNYQVRAHGADQFRRTVHGLHLVDGILGRRANQAAEKVSGRIFCLVEIYRRCRRVVVMFSREDIDKHRPSMV